MQSLGILCVGRLPREEVWQWGWWERAYVACWMEGSVEDSKTGARLLRERKQRGKDGQEGR